MIRLDLVVGPNGAGKTTFVTRVLISTLPPGTPFVNADFIAALRWPENPEAAARQASDAASAARLALIAARRSFVAETVFSHPSKLDLIRDADDAGYSVFLHVLMVGEQTSVHRVAQRVASGGHSVPEIKIRERHRRLWDLVARAGPIVQATSFWDNSYSDRPRTVATFADGILVGNAEWPDWSSPALRALTP